MANKKIYFSEPTDTLANAVGGGTNNIKNGDTKSSIWSKIHKIFRSLKKICFTSSYSDLSNIPTGVTNLANAYANQQVRIWGDSEGGNIAVYSKSKSLEWQQDSYDDSRYRIYCRNAASNKLTAQYFFQNAAGNGNVVTDTMLSNLGLLVDRARIVRAWTTQLNVTFTHDSMGIVLIGKYTDLSAYAVLLVYVILGGGTYHISYSTLFDEGGTMRSIGGPNINASTGVMSITSGSEIEMCYIGA